MNLLFGRDAEVAQWVGERIPHVGDGPSFGPCAAIGIVDGEGFLRGGVVYHNHLPDYGNIELSFAADTPRWLTREIICALLRFPFSQLSCARITGVTPQHATSARRFLDKFGFKREGCLRKGFGNDNAIISGLLREEWEASKWAAPLPKRQEARMRAHEQEGSQSTASA